MQGYFLLTHLNSRCDACSTPMYDIMKGHVLHVQTLKFGVS